MQNPAFLKRHASLLAFGLTASLPLSALAIPFSNALLITGQVEFDSLGDPPPATGGASQSGTLTRIASGTTTTTTLSGDLVGGADPLAGTLTNIGDGFGATFSGSGTARGSTPAELGQLYGDMWLSLENTSATDSFEVVLKLAYSARTAASGTDAFSTAQVVIPSDSLPGGFFYSDLSTDTVNGDRKYVYPDPDNQATGTGESQSDSGTLFLTYLLAPGQSALIDDSGYEQFLWGGAYGDGDSFSASLSALLTVESVTNLNFPPDPNPMPLPGTVALLAAGALGLRANRRKQGEQ